MYKNLICIFMMLILSSCSYFQIRRPVIEQGNIITEEAINQLHTGMSQDQVIGIMGAPVLSNILTPNRMEYVYTYQSGTNPRVEKRVSLIFNQGRVQEIVKR